MTHGLSIVADLFSGEGDQLVLHGMLWSDSSLTFVARCGPVVKKIPSFL